MASRCVGCQNRDAAIADLTKEVERLRKIHSGYDLEALLETYILLHKGKVTAHWLWVAIERIGGGETVAECLEDYGYVPLTRAEAAERKLARLVDDLEPVHKAEILAALDEDDSLTFVSYDELCVKLDEATGEGK